MKQTSFEPQRHKDHRGNQRFAILFRAALFVVLLLIIAACNLNTPNEVALQQQSTVESTAEVTAEPTKLPTETEPPYTPLASFTPTRTLRPAPTFEPPTLTRPPTLTPSITPTPTLNIDINIPGLRGAESPTPSTTPGCQVREDWRLTYTVKFDDSLARIAQLYGTFISDLAAGNCLTNPDVITIGQVLHVPGDAPPFQTAIECVPWELLIPVNGTITISGDGQLTFNWRGPLAPRNVLRIYRANAQGVPQTAENAPLIEIMIEQRQNETIDLSRIPEAGTYAWRIFPLTWEYQPTGCEASPTSQFTKAAAPPPTATPNLGGVGP